MAKQLGSTFGDEVIAAGLGGLPFAWGSTDDSISGREALTPEQNAKLDTVIAAHDAAKKPVAPVSKVQALVALHRVGKLDAVKAAVAANPEHQIWFDNTMVWHRDNPLVNALAPAVGLSAKDLDDLFALAATITD